MCMCVFVCVICVCVALCVCVYCICVCRYGVDVCPPMTIFRVSYSTWVYVCLQELGTLPVVTPLKKMSLYPHQLLPVFKSSGWGPVRLCPIRERVLHDPGPVEIYCR